MWQCQKLYEKLEDNMKNENQPVGQASRLSEHSLRRHLPHYQLSTGYCFVTFPTHNRLKLQSSQKDCVFHLRRGDAESLIRQGSAKMLQ